jgi:glucokinase
MAYTGGVDLGGTKIQTVVVDAGGEVAGQSRRPTPTTGGPADVAAEIAGALEDAAAEAGVKTSSLEGIGVGSPGNVDDTAGTVSAAMNLPGWGGSFNLRKALE